MLKFKQKGQSTPIFTIALFILMLGCILALVVFGSGIYGVIVDNKGENGAKRAGLSYITQRVRSAEEANAIKVVQGPEGDALVLMELSEETGCETRIYLSEGKLLEEYAFSESSFSPENAQPITETDSFHVKIENGQILVSTSEGASYINLHVKEAS